jgi:hypothetical protein
VPNHQKTPGACGARRGPSAARSRPRPRSGACRRSGAPTLSQVGLEQVESRSPRPPAPSTSRSRWACFSRKRRLSLSPVGIRDSVARRSSISVPMCCRRGAQADQCGRGDLLQPPTTGNTRTSGIAGSRCSAGRGCSSLSHWGATCHTHRARRRGRPPRSLQRPHDGRSASGGYL